ncbi:MAG TPA: galactose-1-phosphate uridylyltransferase [Pseudobdellovibrionaceae bacterium]|jgi:UDPglucose--hexose-1-phosphate uridylyltransferase
MEKRDFIKPDGRGLTLYSRRPISPSILPTNPPHVEVMGTPHLRWHPLRGEWVAYAAHRQNRTFLPPKEYSPLAVTRSREFPTELPAGDYDIAVFENLFPSLTDRAQESPELSIPTKPGKGHCEVVVFTQDPHTSLGALPLDHIELLLQVWADRTRVIGSREEIQYVMPFENRGVEVGVTLHHPHGQIYCYPLVPPIPQRMFEMQSLYFEENQRGLLEDLVQDEVIKQNRLIHEEERVVSFIPPCARYPYETWIAPKRRSAWLYDLNNQELKDFAKTLKTVLLKFDNLWNRTFPYLMVLYQAPTDGNVHPESHVHIEIFPPLRTKDRLKYLAGTELGAGFFINDTLPEEKAAELRAVEVTL